MSIFDFATAAVDVVGIYDSGFNQLVPDARPVKAIITRSAKVMEHPVENGATITDHRVIEPVEIELALLLNDEDYRSTYRNIFAIFERADLITVQTRVDTYPNMLIAAMPHDEVPEMQTAVPLVLKLREVLLVKAQFQALPPKSVSAGKTRNQSTVKRGEQTGTTEPGTGTSRKSSILYRILY